MSTYIKLSTLEYPRHTGDIEIDPDGAADYAQVQWVDQPDFDDATKRCGEGAPEQVGGQWRMTWVIRDATASEIAMANTPKPDEFKRYNWDNKTLSWIETT